MSVLVLFIGLLVSGLLLARLRSLVLLALASAATVAVSIYVWGGQSVWLTIAAAVGGLFALQFGFLVGSLVAARRKASRAAEASALRSAKGFGVR